MAAVPGVSREDIWNLARRSRRAPKGRPRKKRGRRFRLFDEVRLPTTSFLTNAGTTSRCLLLRTMFRDRLERVSPTTVSDGNGSSGQTCPNRSFFVFRTYRRRRLIRFRNAKQECCPWRQARRAPLESWLLTLHCKVSNWPLQCQDVRHTATKTAVKKDGG